MTLLVLVTGCTSSRPLTNAGLECASSVSWEYAQGHWVADPSLKCNEVPMDGAKVHLTMSRDDHSGETQVWTSEDEDWRGSTWDLPPQLMPNRRGIQTYCLQFDAEVRGDRRTYGVQQHVSRGCIGG